MQPTYFPWIGDFDLIDQVDIYVFYDDVQVVKRNWDVRNRIKISGGELYLTVPIKKTNHRDETLFINAIIQDDELWRRKHLLNIQSAYKKSTFFREVYPFIESLIESEFNILADLNINIIQYIAERIGITTKFVRSSSLKSKEGRRDFRLVEICKELSCNQYLSPQGSAVYIEECNPGGEFTKNNIELFYRNYEHPTYFQLHGDFLPYMCIIDILFNEGFENTITKIKEGRKPLYGFLEYRKIIGK